MAVKQEFTFLSGDGKTDVHAVRWLPDNGDYRAVFQISHGMIEFIERYEPFAAFLADKGYMVVGHDHLGHGKTAKTPEDWGYFADGESPEILIGDMNKLRTLSQEPDKPYFMLGHSMGSYLLRRYLSVYGGGLSGAVIMGTGANPVSGNYKKILFCKVTVQSQHYQRHHLCLRQIHQHGIRDTVIHAKRSSHILFRCSHRFFNKCNQILLLSLQAVLCTVSLLAVPPPDKMICLLIVQRNSVSRLKIIKILLDFNSHSANHTIEIFN